MKGMKAVQINGYGGSEVVEINQNAPKPVLSSGKVLVEVKAAGINPADWKIREGYFQKMVPLKFPATLGGDFSGVVADVADGVLGFKKGDEVFGQASLLSGGRRRGFWPSKPFKRRLRLVCRVCIGKYKINF
ncbi:MAG: alcohol dehydrogenase catalytic domain-containing protein [Candidatus Diapherotrites archaeon]|nr:alcohol dehydrogenase catalytic domain-containing protein [Candidatus Diapherotrites archaeon]